MKFTDKQLSELRSQWEFGEAEECRRGLMCGMAIRRRSSAVRSSRLSIPGTSTIRDMCT